MERGKERGKERAGVEEEERDGRKTRREECISYMTV